MKKNIYNYHEIFFFFGTELRWATAQVSLRLGAGRVGAGRAGTTQAAWARGRAPALGRQALGRWGALGVAGMGVRSAGEHERGAARHGVRGAQAAWKARARQGAAGARTRHGRVGACGRHRLGGLCAPGVRSWARLGVLLHLTQFLAWFDSVFFPSHQMNTVHCEIKFFEKKIFFLNI